MTVFALDGAFRQPVLWVNKNGERFLNEDLTPNSTFTGCAIINQPENVGISIMDQKMVNTYKKKVLIFWIMFTASMCLKTGMQMWKMLWSFMQALMELLAVSRSTICVKL